MPEDIDSISKELQNVIIRLEELEKLCESLVKDNQVLRNTLTNLLVEMACCRVR